MFKGRIFICADLHGSEYSCKGVVRKIKDATKEDILIIAGDAGLEYDYVKNEGAKELLNAFSGKIIVMRGNHDSCYWAEHIKIINDKSFSIAADWDVLVNGQDEYLFEKRYPNILYVRDSGGIYTIGKYNFLFLPGAYSIDKEIRKLRDWPYNQNEQLTPQEKQELLDLTKDYTERGFPIDYVIGHTFPLKLEPLYNFLFLEGVDENKVDKKTEQWLDSMSEIFEKNKSFKKYYGGHMHKEMPLNSKYYMVYQNPIEL